MVSKAKTSPFLQHDDPRGDLFDQLGNGAGQDDRRILSARVVLDDPLQGQRCPPGSRPPENGSSRRRIGTSATSAEQSAIFFFWPAE